MSFCECFLQTRIRVCSFEKLCCVYHNSSPTHCRSRTTRFVSVLFFRSTHQTRTFLCCRLFLFHNLVSLHVCFSLFAPFEFSFEIDFAENVFCCLWGNLAQGFLLSWLVALHCNCSIDCAYVRRFVCFVLSSYCESDMSVWA